MFSLFRLTFFFGSLALITALPGARTSNTHGNSTGIGPIKENYKTSARELSRNIATLLETYRKREHATGASFLHPERTSTTSDNNAIPKKQRGHILSNRNEIPSNNPEEFLGHRLSSPTQDLEVPGTNSTPTSLHKNLEHRPKGHPRFKKAVEDSETKDLNKMRTNDKHGKETKLGEVDLGISNAVLEPMPKPMAQNSTDSPFDFTRRDDFFTIPEHDFDEITPLIPLVTRTRDGDVKNPFYPVTSETYGAYIILIIAVIIFSVGILGNITIMCIVCHNYYMRSISNSLLANLALWDFIIIFFCLPLVIFHELTKDWLLGEFSCKIIPYLEVSIHS